MDKVYCPYCGKCMNPKINKLGLHAYECINCFSISPIAATNDGAVAMAQTRVKPLQKPLSLEEAIERRILWLETAYCEETIRNLYPAIKTQTAMYNGTACFATDNCRIVRFNAFDYDKTWRCWATKPTDEEREAAKWDE